MPSRHSPKPHVVAVSPPDPVELSRQLLKVQEEERRRISRELHDETGQSLMILRFHLEMLGADMRGEDQKGKVQESLDVLDRAIEGLRRTIARLSPRVLEELGLVTAIRRQAEVLARHFGIKGHLELPEELAAMDHDVQVALYRSVQEALHNVAKHSHAENFTVRLTATGSKVVLQVEDDGTGFSPRTGFENGFGLTGMRERASALGGSTRVISEKGKGTRLRISLPISESPSKRQRGIMQRVTTARAS